MLNDSLIRKNLIDFLSKKKPSPTSIVEELHVHNGNAIADVVAIYSHLHCFEIKGETDSVSRVLVQSNFYNTSFDKITLVTTANHMPWALKNTPSFWGIIVAEEISDVVKLRYKRGARRNPFFCKEKALMMLWKDELKNIAYTSKLKIKSSDTRNDLANKIGDILRKDDALNAIQSAIMNRESSRKTSYDISNM